MLAFSHGSTSQTEVGNTYENIFPCGIISKYVTECMIFNKIWNYKNMIMLLEQNNNKLEINLIFWKGGMGEGIGMNNPNKTL